MTRQEAREIVDHVAGLATCESATANPKHGGWAVTVRMVGEPPRTFTDYARAFRTYCAADPDDA